MAVKAVVLEHGNQRGLSNHSLSISGTVGRANEIKMSKPIRPAYVTFNHKRSFFVPKKKVS